MSIRRLLKFTLLLSLSLSALFLLLSLSSTSALDDSDDDDLRFLLEDPDLKHQNDAAAATPPPSATTATDLDDDDDDFENYDDDFQVPSSLHGDDETLPHDENVVVLGERNFTDFVESNEYVMVEFYAPWCEHCKALAPEYSAAAKQLEDEEKERVKLAKVDATTENELAEEYEVQGFPTVYFFVDGDHVPYTGRRTKEAIVTWVKKRIGPGVYNITTTKEVERVLTSEDKVVLGFLESLVGSDSEELAAASKLADDVNFYQTVNPDVAKLFHMDPDAKRPTLIMLKKEEEKLNPFDGQFVKSAIAEFVSANKLPLVTKFTKESAPTIFENPIKKQLLLFATSNDSEKVIPTFQEAAKLFKEKLIFVYIEMDNEEVGRPVSDYFGITGDSPQVIGYLGNDNAKKFIFHGEVTLNKIKVFGEDFVQDKLKPFYKSDPIPETNDADVKVVVGNNFDEIVLDDSKDVLLEVYATWCGHCQALEPTYSKLATHLRGIESLVIAKMDGTTNEHPSFKAEGFPTLLFFPAGNKSSDPISVDSDHTVVALYKFLKKHAAIPFQLQRPAPIPKPESHSAEESINGVKEEL